MKIRVSLVRFRLWAPLNSTKSTRYVSHSFGACVAQSSHSSGCVGVVGITVVNTVFVDAVGTVCLGHGVHNTVLEHSVPVISVSPATSQHQIYALLFRSPKECSRRKAQGLLRGLTRHQCAARWRASADEYLLSLQGRSQASDC